MAKNNISFPSNPEEALKTKKTYDNVFNYASDNFEKPLDHMPSPEKFIKSSTNVEDADLLIGNFEDLGWNVDTNIGAEGYETATDFFKDALSVTENIDDTGTSLGVLNNTTALLDEVTDKSKQYVIDNASDLETNVMTDGTKVIENLGMVSDIGKDVAQGIGKDLAKEGAKELAKEGTKEAGKGVPFLGLGLATADAAVTFADDESSAMDKVGASVDVLGSAGLDAIPPFAIFHGVVKGVDILEDLLT